MRRDRETSRRSLTRALAVTLISTLATLTACSDSEQAAAPTAADSSSTPSSASSDADGSPPPATETATPVVDTTAVPAPLAGLAEGLYAAGQVPMTDAVRAALGDRAVADLAARVEVAGATGRWKTAGSPC